METTEPGSIPAANDTSPTLHGDSDDETEAVTTPGAIPPIAPFEHAYFHTGRYNGACLVCGSRPATGACAQCAFPRCAEPVCHAESEAWHTAQCAMRSRDGSLSLLRSLLEGEFKETDGPSGKELVPPALWMASLFRDMAARMAAPENDQVERVLWDTFRQRGLPRPTRPADLERVARVPSLEGTPQHVIAEYVLLAALSHHDPRADAEVQALLTTLSLLSNKAAFKSVLRAPGTNQSLPHGDRCYIQSLAPETATDGAPRYVTALTKAPLVSLLARDMETDYCNAFYLVTLMTSAPGRAADPKAAAAVAIHEHQILLRLLPPLPAGAAASADARFAMDVMQAHDRLYTLAAWLKHGGRNLTKAKPRQLHSKPHLLNQSRFGARVDGARNILAWAAVVDDLCDPAKTSADRARLYGDITGVRIQHAMGPFLAHIVRLNWNA